MIATLFVVWLSGYAFADIRLQLARLRAALRQKEGKQ